MGQIRVRRALISVYDKTGVVEFAQSLHADFGIEIISTGGTAKTLGEAGIPVTLIEDITGFPEMLDGRVKTLHPNIHAAILADRDNPEHMRQLEAAGIKPIDMVVVNLYPFEKTVADPNCTLDQAIEMIDIGGVALLRAAAKNHKHVSVWTSVFSDRDLIERMLRNCEQSIETRRSIAMNTLSITASYDWAISRYLAGGDFARGVQIPVVFSHYWPLRYGENSHQTGGVYSTTDYRLATATGTPNLVQGPRRREGHWWAEQDMTFSSRRDSWSYNNYLDADAALALCADIARSFFNNEPRASARADVPHQQSTPKPEVLSLKSAPTAHTAGVAAIRRVLQSPDARTPTWFLTWTTYGTWLPGDVRGFVSRAPRPGGKHFPNNIPGTWYDADQQDVAASARERMEGKPVQLESRQLDTLLTSFAEVCDNHQIGLLAVAVMSDHVHIACQSDRDGGELLQFFKGVSSRRLSQDAIPPDAPRWWTKSGSCRHIPAGADLEPLVAYIEQQLEPLVIVSSRATAGVGASADEGLVESGTPARAEARGSFPTQNAVCVFVKHNNACGVGVVTPGSSAPKDVLAAQIEAYSRAYLGDPNAAMGGVLACNFDVDAEFAQAVMSTFDRLGKPLRDSGAAHAPGGFFVEAWAACGFSEDSRAVIRGELGWLDSARDREGVDLSPSRIAQVRALVGDAAPKAWGKNLRLVPVGPIADSVPESAYQFRSIAGGVLIQTPDTLALNESDWKVATNRAPTAAEMRDLRLAWLICKHTKSNAITICKDGRLIGNGAGQMSRVMSCRIATWLAKENGHAEALTGSVAASDAFFPFKDGPQILIDAGVTALIQPGGSKRDDETIALCNERAIAMILTGARHFRH